MFYNSVWGSIVDSNWDINDATVVCHQVGFNGATEAVTTAEFGNGKGPVYMEDVACSGSEFTLLDCLYKAVKDEVVGRQDVAVRCASSESGDST